MASVFVYNPFDTFTLFFTGRPFTFERNTITEVKDVVLKEPDTIATYGEHGERAGEVDRTGIIYKDVPVSGEKVAMELIVKHEYDKRGVKILSENKISELDRKQAQMEAETYKRLKVQEYQIARMNRRAGGMGPTYPGRDIHAWILEFDIEDEVVNPRRATPKGELDYAALGREIGAGVVAAMNASTTPKKN